MVALPRLGQEVLSNNGEYGGVSHGVTFASGMRCNPKELLPSRESCDMDWMTEETAFVRGGFYYIVPKGMSA